MFWGHSSPFWGFLDSEPVCVADLASPVAGQPEPVNQLKLFARIPPLTPLSSQEPGPAKVAVTSNSSSIPSAEKVPTTKSTLWQEEMRAKDQPDGSNLSPAQSPRQSQPSSASSLREPGLESKEGERGLAGLPAYPGVPSSQQTGA